MQIKHSWVICNYILLLLKSEQHIKKKKFKNIRNFFLQNPFSTYIFWPKLLKGHLQLKIDELLYEPTIVIPKCSVWFGRLTLEIFPP